MFANFPYFGDSAARFMDETQMDMAIESVPENPMLPDSWNRPEYHHFQVVLMRPGQPETHFPVTFSTQLENGPLLRDAAPMVEIRPTAESVLILMASEMAYYEQHQTVEAWAAHRHLELTPDLVAAFPTFARERRTLMQFFGEHYPEFLAIGTE